VHDARAPKRTMVVENFSRITTMDRRAALQRIQLLLMYCRDSAAAGLKVSCFYGTQNRSATALSLEPALLAIETSIGRGRAAVGEEGTGDGCAVELL
jgi:hypothetical protein